MCRHFCIGFMDFILKDNRLTDFSNFFSPDNFKKGDDLLLNYFKNELKF